MASFSPPTHASRSGFFGLSLNVSQTQDLKHLDYRIEVTKKLLRDFEDGLTATAVRNLQGVFYFYRKKTSKALECFKYILDNEDHHNKNALANTLIVYQRLSRSSLAQQYDKRINDLPKNGSDKRRIDAVSAAEQAFAYQFDCYIEEDELQRAYKSVPLYEESIFILQETLCTDKLLKRLEMEVKYWYAQCKHKIHCAGYRRTDVPNLEQDPYTSAVCDLWNIAKCEEMLPVLKSGAHTYLGLFSFKKPRKENILKSHELCKELQQLLDSPDQCFQTALNILETTEAHIRYAAYLKMNNQVDKAIKHLKKAWHLDDSKGNWFALTSLAQTHLKKFSDRNSHENKAEKIRHLKTAIELWERSVEINATALDLSALGEAYHMKAKLDAAGAISPESDDAAKASEYFYQAVQSLGIEKKPEVHRKHGRFLKDIGEKRQAIESFKRAMEVDTANKPTASFQQLFETFLEMYNAEREDINEETSSVRQITESSASGTLGSDQHQERDEGHRKEEKPTETEMKNMTSEQLQSPVQSQEVASEGGATNVLNELQLVHTSAENTEDGSRSMHVNIDTTSKLKPDEVLCSKTAVEIAKEEQRERTEMTLKETDIELDASTSSDAVQSLVYDTEKKFKSWKYKDNGLLYEMAYWFRFASKKYTEKMEIMTTKFASKYPEEIAMVIAYFLSESDCVCLSESILDVFKGTTEWESKLEHAKSLLKPKPKGDQSAPKMSDSVCKYCQVSMISSPSFIRQDSTIPEGLERARNIKYEFDFYVIFSEKEKEWVYYSLLQNLESNYGFKGAIPERDFIVGRDKLSEMARCMTSSFKILMLIRSHMDEFDSNKCVYQMNLAKEIGHTSKRQHFLIPVLLENCCPPVQLSSLICVHAVEKYAWHKIVRSLEHR